MGTNSAYIAFLFLAALLTTTFGPYNTYDLFGLPPIPEEIKDNQVFVSYNMPFKLPNNHTNTCKQAQAQTLIYTFIYTFIYTHSYTHTLLYTR